MASRHAQASSSSSSHDTKRTSKDEPLGQDQSSTDEHLELLTEHFGFNPKSFIDSLVYVSNEHLYIMGEKFHELVKAQLKKRPNGDAEAEQGVHAILTLFENALDHTFDTLELYCLKSVFGITSRQARYITLEHHRGLDLRLAEEKTKGKGSSSKLSAKEESEALSERQNELERKISAARAVRHSLALANAAADQRLARISKVVDRFSFLVGDEGAADVETPLASTLPLAARKLRTDTSALLKALHELRATDPLGASLNPLQGGRESAGETTEAWEKGREGYLAWETGRILAKEKKEGNSTGDATPPAQRAEGKKRKQSSEVGGRASKRTADDGNDGSDDQETTQVNEAVGDADQMEALSAALQ
ncbi:hypothetical protein FA10DRAFT_265335 [Acaromyces ingoldii]|uniref:Mis12-domain-containing protein n=1 Tax=Acaromyces ingoldii TaxID=215250 RepID=A0A316YS36_9BASI|nr:hypothetical protein FA10DRAFT_265335 [Acaromyces ingoldii]PWN91478.1 hypothetical protein FA10DRAFT_265335 [Acaromyces ingoldii]